MATAYALALAVSLRFSPQPQERPSPAFYEISGVKTSHMEFGEKPKPLSVKERIARAWPGDDAWALRVTWCESRHDPKARNRGSSATGLFQDLRSTWQRMLGQKGEARDFSVEYQVKQNWRLYKNYGPSQWVCK